MKPGDLRRFKVNAIPFSRRARFNGKVFMIVSEEQHGKVSYFDILIDGEVDELWAGGSLERRSEALDETR
jgi:hypothetical protein